MGGHLAIPQNGILYTNEPSMSIHLSWKAIFPVSQRWLLIAGSTVYNFYPLEIVGRGLNFMCVKIKLLTIIISISIKAYTRLSNLVIISPSICLVEKVKSHTSNYSPIDLHVLLPTH